MRQKILTFNFKDSGNSCDVFMDLNKLHDGFCPLHDGSCPLEVLWDYFPPSRKDQKIWAKKYLPEVSRRIATLLQKKVGLLVMNAAGELAVIDPSQWKES